MLKELIQKASLQDTIIKELVAILRIVVKDDDDEVDGKEFYILHVARQRRNKAALDNKLTSGGWMKNSPKEEQRQTQSIYVQQAYAAKLLRYNL